VFDRCTSQLTVYQGAALLARVVEVTTVAEARAAIQAPGHRPNTGLLRLLAPVRLDRSDPGLPPALPRDTEYTLELVLFPTDVTNHYSGAPFTRCGAEVWTCYGRGGQEQVGHRGTNFTFGPGGRGGRSCLGEGQLPGVLYWPLPGQEGEGRAGGLSGKYSDLVKR
jgi:hypothetical protein